MALANLIYIDLTHQQCNDRGQSNLKCPKKGIFPWTDTISIGKFGWSDSYLI